MIVNLVTIHQRGRDVGDHLHDWVSYEFLWTGLSSGTQTTKSVICVECSEVRKIEKQVSPID